MTKRTQFAGTAMAVAVLAAAAAAWHLLGPLGTREQKVALLDPAQVEIVRTPGGFLQVSEMRKAEEFGWKTSWDCPLLDCSALPATVSKVRVQAHYVYRIPLAASWRLEPAGDHYRLRVPPLQLQAPVAFDTSTMEVATTQQSLISPAAAPNRENAIRHLGPELAARGASAAYVAAQTASAEQTVREFARQWMREQGRTLQRPVEVAFDGPNPL